MGFFARLSSKEEKNLGFGPILNNECQTFISDIIVATLLAVKTEDVQAVKEYKESVECFATLMRMANAQRFLRPK